MLVVVSIQGVLKSQNHATDFIQEVEIQTIQTELRPWKGLCDVSRRFVSKLFRILLLLTAALPKPPARNPGKLNEKELSALQTFQEMLGDLSVLALHT